MPLGFKTGAGVIFGTTGGVTEAVLRYAVEKLTGVQLDAVRLPRGARRRGPARGDDHSWATSTLKLAIVHGLAKRARPWPRRSARASATTT